jgi:hypothetical protein
MIPSPDTRPWYKMRWQMWVIAIVVILGSGVLHYQANKPIEIEVTSSPTGQNRTLKERMIFVTDLEKKFHKKGWIAKIDIEGENGKTLKVYWEQLDLPFVRQWVQSQDIIADIREMGFKRLLMGNGKDEWDIDLKN